MLTARKLATRWAMPFILGLVVVNLIVWESIGLAIIGRS